MYDYKSSLFRVVRRARRALLAPRISHANLILAHFFHVTHDGLTVKPRPNDRNRSTQHIATLLAQYLQAPAKRSQHFDATYRNIVGRNMLRAFGHPVATCCDMLGVVGLNLKQVKFFIQRLWMLHDVVVARPGSCNNVAPGHTH